MPSPRRRSFWETYFRPPTILANGVEMPLREALNFIFDLGAGDPTVEDDPVLDATTIPLTGWTALAPGGDEGDLQYKAGAMAFGGTARLRRAGDGELEHGGRPRHLEEWSDFRDGTDPSFPRAQWKVGHTTDATQTTIATISIPAATHGDCFVGVQVRVTYYFASSGTKGGVFAREATFSRSAGALAAVGSVDLTPAGLSAGTVPGGIALVANGNDAIDVKATGILATNITWVVSLHMQLARAA